MKTSSEIAVALEPSTSRKGQVLLTEAAALGIPWEAILEKEIRAERTLRAWLEDDGEWRLREILWLLPRSFLDSWRARQRIHGLAWEVFSSGCEESRSELGRVAKRLCRHREKLTAASIQVKHLWFAHQRILALARISRAAERSRGNERERLEQVERTTDCSPEDARWAVLRVSAPSPGHRLDACVGRARDEGYEIPAASSEVHAFRLLKRFVKSVVACTRTNNSNESSCGVPDERTGVAHGRRFEWIATERRRSFPMTGRIQRRRK